MSAANVYTPTRYDERVWRLAVGIEPWDATTGRRRSAGLDVRLEQADGAVGGSMRRHPTGRFSRRYDDSRPHPIPATLDVRVVDTGARWVVPRRLRLPVAAETDTTAWRHVFRLGVHPGAGAAVPAGATVLRGRVVRETGPATGAQAPVRWCRVRARNDDGDDVGWAHGDDRGEFVLVVAALPDGVLIPANPVRLHVTIGAVATPPDPDPDPADPLHDLPRETVAPSPDPLSEPTLTGHGFLPGQTEFGPFTHSLPIGRETSVVHHLP